MTLTEFNDLVAFEVKTTVELLSQVHGIPVTVASGVEGRMAFSGPRRGVLTGQMSWEIDADAVPAIPLGAAVKSP